MAEEIRYFVRIMNKDLDGQRPVFRALRGIKGIGTRMAGIIAMAFEKETGIAFNTPLGKISEDQEKILEELLVHPEKHGIPSWNLNRRKDFETGTDHHLVMSDLDFTLRKDLQRLNEIKSYRGLRHSWGLPVRGQKTKSTHRKKGGVVGVSKTAAKAGAAPKPAAAAAPAKAEKKK